MNKVDALNSPREFIPEKSTPVINHNTKKEKITTIVNKENNTKKESRIYDTIKTDLFGMTRVDVIELSGILMNIEDRRDRFSGIINPSENVKSYADKLINLGMHLTKPFVIVYNRVHERVSDGLNGI